MSREPVDSGYAYHDSRPSYAHPYLWPAVVKVLERRAADLDKRVFEIGCGNGATANMLNELGYEVTGIDSSESGIRIAKAAFPHLDLSLGSAYDDLAGRFGTFPIVLSLEVIEHCYSPRKFAQTAFDLLDEGGMAVISTPYHGYVKNLALSVLGKWDFHFGVLDEGGHIKFFSRRTLRSLLSEAGFCDISFSRVGRVAPFARSMIALSRRPKADSDAP